MGVNKNDLPSQFLHSTGDQGIDFLRLLKKNSLRKDSIAGTGPYVAQVLRVERITIGEDESWLNDIKLNLSYENSTTIKQTPNALDNKKWIRVYARITSDYLPGQPNIHSYIPMPKQLGSVSDLRGDSRSNTLITMHTAFMGSVENSEIPSPGDFIWVDYLDKANLLKPVFLEKILTSAAGRPCLDAVCSPPSLAFVPPKAGLLNGSTTTVAPISDNHQPIAELSPPRPGGKEYELKVYQASDFTSYSEFITGEYKTNFLVTLCIMEIITFHFENVYPNDEITIKPNKNPGIAYPPQALFSSQENRHHIGKAFDVEIYRNGNPIDKSLIWASLLKLIEAGRIPDGGIGFYQTNADKGPNAGIATTFGTALPPSDWPHYDWDDQGDRPAKWIEGTVDKKDVVFSSTTIGKWGTATAWIQASIDGLNHMPPYCVSALSNPHIRIHPSLPNYANALSARLEVEESKTHNPTQKNVVDKEIHQVSKKVLENLGLQPATVNTVMSQLALKQEEETRKLVGDLMGQSVPSKSQLEEWGRSPISFKPQIQKTCGPTGKGHKLRTPVTEEKLKLLNTAANLPPGLIIDQRIMSKPQSSRASRLPNISIFVIHEVGADVTPYNIVTNRASAIKGLGLKKVKYTTPGAVATAKRIETLGPKPKKGKQARLDWEKKKRLMKKEGKHHAKQKALQRLAKLKGKKHEYQPRMVKTRGGKKVPAKTQLSQEAKDQLDQTAAEALEKAQASAKKFLEPKQEEYDTANAAYQEALTKFKAAKAAYSKKRMVYKKTPKAQKALKQTQKNAMDAAKNAMVDAKDVMEQRKKVRKAAVDALRAIKRRYAPSGKMSLKSGRYRIRKKEGRAGEVYWSPNKNVHFWSGRAGDIIAGSDWSRRLAHANWSNKWSVGNEVCVGAGGYVSTNKERMINYAAKGGKSIGTPTAFWGPIHPKHNRQFFLQLGISGMGWHGGYGRCMPGRIMMERQFQLSQWLGSSHNPYASQYARFNPNWFPCTLNSDKHSPFKTWSAIGSQNRANKVISDLYKEFRDYKSSKAAKLSKKARQKQNKKYRTGIDLLLRQQKYGNRTGHWKRAATMSKNADLKHLAPDVNVDREYWRITEPLFCWGFFSPDTQFYGRDGGWKRNAGKGVPARVKTQHDWQKGITAHTRWGPHTDGCIIEYYVLGRVLGLSSEDAFYACVGAWCSAGNKSKGVSGVINKSLAFTDSRLTIPPRQFTYFPDNERAGYVSLGKAIWNGNPVSHHNKTIAEVQKTYGTRAEIKNIPLFKDYANPLDWPMSRNTLFNPGAKIKFPNKNGTIETRDIPMNRRYTDKKIRVKFKDPISGKKKTKYVYAYGEGVVLPGPFGSNSHYTAEPGTRKNIIEGNGLGFLPKRERKTHNE